MVRYRYELVLDVSGHWFFRRRSRNGEIVFHSEAYANKSNARRAIRRLDPNATIVVVTG